MSDFFRRSEVSDFFKKFLLEDPRRFSATGKYVALAAFGKHPGWDDHVEDLGLETESLNLTKTVLYVKGIGGQIDAGAWEKLEATQQLPAFKHVFVWQRSGQILVGRLWSSSDGKGRKRYPMVVCCHFMGVTLGWALKHSLPALAEIEQSCAKATGAEEVRRLLDRERATLRDRIQSAEGGEYAPLAPEALNRILHVAGEPGSEGFYRVLYMVQSQFGAFATGSFGARGNLAGLRAQQLRSKAAGRSPEEALLFWSRFFLAQVDPAAPLLLTLPLEAEWVDVTAGEPEAHEFFCLRATPQAIPMVNEVPYTLDDAFRNQARVFLEHFETGATTGTRFISGAAVSPDAASPAKTGWRKWLGLGTGMVAALVQYLSQNGG
jgi:hypothetical protein